MKKLSKGFVLLNKEETQKYVCDGLEGLEELEHKDNSDKFRVLIIGYTQTDTYEEFKDYIRNRKYLATGDYVPTKHMFISKSGITIEHISLRQHRRDALQQYLEVDVSPLALKHMKPSDLEWIQSLMIMGDD